VRAEQRGRARWRLLAAAAVALACGQARPSVILVSVDTLRADQLGAYGSDLGLSPHIDALAGESQLFERAYAPAPFTLPSVSALLSCRHPVELGVDSNESRLPADVATLATLLSGHGYRTGAVVSNFVLRRQAGLDRGFDVYDDAMTAREEVRHLPERSAEDTTTAALRVLDELRVEGGAVFLWVHYQDPHGPYNPPDGFRERALAEAERTLHERRLPFASDDRGLGGIPRYQRVGDEDRAAFYLAGYRGEIAYLDGQIGGLLAGLEERGLLDGAWIAFTADHGEGLGENDYWFAHGEYLTDPLVHVPLLVRVPGRAGSRHGATASLLDVVPTLARGVGLEQPLACRGRDVFAPAAPMERNLVLATLRGSSEPRYGLIAGSYKLLAKGAWPPGPPSLFVLGDETRDVAQDHADLVRRLVADLSADLRVMATGSKAPRQELTLEERERLRALGYATDP
jgi:arylsulfatase A-like enzyme